MDYTDAALSYTLLLFPLAFAGVVISQGIAKIKKKDNTGKVVLGFGILFLLLVPIMYFLLIKL